MLYMWCSASPVLYMWCIQLRGWQPRSPEAASLALVLYEMGCGYECDGLPPIYPASCPPAVREALSELLLPAPAPERAAREQQESRGSPQRQRAPPARPRAAHSPGRGGGGGGGGSVLDAAGGGAPPRPRSLDDLAEMELFREARARCAARTRGRTPEGGRRSMIAASQLALPTGRYGEIEATSWSGRAAVEPALVAGLDAALERGGFPPTRTA